MSNLSNPLQLNLSILTAIFIGLVQTYFLGIAWAYIPIYSPLPNWLLSLDLAQMLFSTFLFLLDLLINIFLCIPAAYLLSRLQPQKLALYLALAVLPGFFWQYSNAFTNPTSFSPFLTFVPGIAMALLMLPLASLAVTWARRRRNT
jgi:hypothetical protein